VVILTRIRLANGEPLALEMVYLPHHRCPDILQHDFAVESLYDVLRTSYGYQLVQARQTIEAILAMERVTFTSQGFPIEYVRSFYRGDRYEFRALLCPTQTVNTGG